MKYACTVLISISLIVCLMGCKTAPVPLTAGPMIGLENPSLHIMVKESEEPPITGSFGWGFSLLKLPPEFGMALSAVNKRLHYAMLVEMTHKGLVFDESDPDLLLSYAVAGGGEIHTDELNQAYGDMIDASFLAMESDLHYKHGVLILDVLDRKSGELLWRGAIMAEIDMTLPDEQKQARCSAAVKALLQHYPRPGTIDQ
jgi:hypothetical protein